MYEYSIDIQKQILYGSHKGQINHTSPKENDIQVEILKKNMIIFYQKPIRL